MTVYVRHVTQISFDGESRHYRAAVEFFPEDYSKAPISIPVHFGGEPSLPFSEVCDLACKAAEITLAALLRC
jgi:hypothetical protein